MYINSLSTPPIIHERARLKYSFKNVRTFPIFQTSNSKKDDITGVFESFTKSAHVVIHFRNSTSPSLLLVPTHFD